MNQLVDYISSKLNQLKVGAVRREEEGNEEKKTIFFLHQHGLEVVNLLKLTDQKSVRLQVASNGPIKLEIIFGVSKEEKEKFLQVISFIKQIYSL